MANKKASKSGAEKTAQASRSTRNKKLRIERNKGFNANKGRTRSWYLLAKKGNRLRRLQRKVKARDLGADRRNAMLDRIQTLSEELGIQTPKA